jgi:cytochrome c biogenesis protein CcmG/thiol:disulfide interchange protein DsbE
MSMTDNGPAPRGRAIFVLLPLIIFAVIAAIFLISLKKGGDPELIPSVLIGKAAPDFDLPALDGLAANGAAVPGLKKADLLGRVTLVNIFASWCGPCRQEHPLLAGLAKDTRVRLVGINYKDKAENALRFLDDLGNPYAAVGIDARGRTGIDWGVYGVPETFVVGPDGIIRYKYIGPITEDGLAKLLQPEIEKALAAK